MVEKLQGESVKEVGKKASFNSFKGTKDGANRSLKASPLYSIAHGKLE